jgi:surface polysaccharide O-acyltransferase-like enzyme
LTFDALIVAGYMLAPTWGDRLGRAVARLAPRPSLSFLLLITVSALAYIPLALTVSPLDWTVFGPFTVQTSRVLLYALYFVVGIGLGASGADRGLLAVDNRLAKRWPVWVGATVVCFGVAVVLITIAIARPDSVRLEGTIGDLAFVVSCVASSFGLLALFLRWATRPVRVLDSLRDSAYGIYLVHYAAVTWLQFALLGATLPGVVKGTLVFVGALTASWVVVVALRRIPAVARIV